MLQRLSMALSQVKAGKTYKNLLNEDKHIMYSLFKGFSVYLRLNIDQFMDKCWKYKLLNKCIKDYQQHFLK